jgi:serine/threonine-protein kinase RsbW
VRKSSSGTKELVLPSALESLEEIDRATLRIARLAGLDRDAATAVAIAMVEAVTNAIVHGNRRNAEKAVRVSYRWGPGRISVDVHDEGEGFDLSCVADPTDPARCMECSGRGIFIMRQIMDNVEFDMPKGRGTTVTMTKSR